MKGNGPPLFDEEERRVIKRLLRKYCLLPPETIHVSYIYRDEVLISAEMPMRDYQLHTTGQQICFDGAFRSFPGETSVGLMVIEETFDPKPMTATIRVDRPVN